MLWVKPKLLQPLITDWQPPSNTKQTLSAGMTAPQAGRAFNNSSWHCLASQQTTLQQLPADQNSAQHRPSRRAQKRTPPDHHLRCREGNSRSNFNMKIMWNHVKVVLLFSLIHQVMSQAFAGNRNSSVRHLQRAWNLFIFYYLQPHHHHHVLEFGPVGDSKRTSRDAGEQREVLGGICKATWIPLRLWDSYPSCWFSPSQRIDPGSGLK